jgi:hypothetical protein
MGKEICLYKGTRDDSSTEVCIIDPIIYHSKCVPKPTKDNPEDNARAMTFYKENIDKIIKEFKQVFLANNIPYAGISDEMPKVNNGYDYSKIDDEILDEMRKLHPAPSNGYGCTVHPIRQRGVIDVIEEYYASLKK